MSRPLAVLAVAVGLCGGLAAISPARADSSEGPASQTIRVDRSELRSPGGIARIHQQLDEAARSVCHGLESRELGRQFLFRRCVVQALTHAIADVHDPRLTAYHERRSEGLLTAQR
jgi:UrcA family protein